MTTVPTFAPPDVVMERRPDGTIVLGSRVPPAPWEESVPVVLRERAAAHPDRLLAAQRDGQDALGDAHLRRGAAAGRRDRPGAPRARPRARPAAADPVGQLARAPAGARSAPTPRACRWCRSASAYSLHEPRPRAGPRDRRACATPGMVFADDARRVRRRRSTPSAPRRRRRRRPRRPARRAAPRRPRGDRARAPTSSARSRRSARTRSRRSCSPRGRPARRRACQHAPDAVLQPAGARQVWPFLGAEPPVLVDWLPWSHTFGGNHNLEPGARSTAARCTSTTASPRPPLFARTVAALRDVSPTVYFNVPAGYALLAPRARGATATLAETFFSRLRFMFYAGAALPAGALGPPARARRRGRRTTTCRSPPRGARPRPRRRATTRALRRRARCGCIGVPLPGVTLKLAPDGEKLEIRVTRPERHARLPPRPRARPRPPSTRRASTARGDAGALVDPGDPEPGPAVRRAPRRGLQAR